LACLSWSVIRSRLTWSASFDLPHDPRSSPEQLLGGQAGKQIAQEVNHRRRLGNKIAARFRRVTAYNATIAVKQEVGESVDVSVKRPRASGAVHRMIVAEGEPPLR
jgi:hypothetical protein